jgi:phosphomevalonate kinase
MLIGIAGKMGCGKDYICNTIIIPYFKSRGKDILQVSFADQIKVNVMTKNNIPFSDVFVQKTNSTRKLLQMEGTELGRNVYGDDIWIKYLNNWLKIYKSRGIEHFICTDVRFKNELDYIKQNGGIIIKIVAPNRNFSRLQQESRGDTSIRDALKSHPSECDLDDVPDNHFDLVIYNDLDDILDRSKITKYFDFRMYEIWCKNVI